MHSGEKESPSPRGDEDQTDEADEAAGEGAASESERDKPKFSVRDAPKSPDANPIDPRVGNR